LFSLEWLMKSPMTDSNQAAGCSVNSLDMTIVSLSTLADLRREWCETCPQNLKRK